MSESELVIAPCNGGCGDAIHDYGPVGDDWFCSSCWPREKLKRAEAARNALRAEVAQLRIDLERERVISGGLREDRDGIVKNWRECEKELERLRESYSEVFKTCGALAIERRELESALRKIANHEITDEGWCAEEIAKCALVGLPSCDHKQPVGFGCPKCDGALSTAT